MDQPEPLQAEWDLHWMRVALSLALEAGAAGEVPVGAVVVGPDDRMVATGKNAREQSHDPTAHAEVLAIRAAAVARGHWRLDDLTLYVTLEPCAMCAGALVLARVRRVVFGCTDSKGGGVVSCYGIGRDAKLNHSFELSQGVCEAECAEVLRDFFRALRASGKNGRYTGNR